MMTISYAVSSPSKQPSDSQNDRPSLLSTSSGRSLRNRKYVLSRPDNKTGKKILKQQRNKLRHFGAPHHESPYCYYVLRQNLDLLKSKSTLVTIVQALQKEVKHLQRWYLKQLPIPQNQDFSKRRRIRPEVQRIQKLIIPNWSASLFNSGSDNTTKDFTETLNVIRDGLILIGTTIFNIEAKERVKRNNTIVKRLRNIQQHSHDPRYGIHPVLKTLNSIIAKLTGTSVPSQLCSGDHLLKIVEELMAVPKNSICSKRSESQTYICHLSSFFTAFRRFLNRSIPVIVRFE